MYSTYAVKDSLELAIFLHGHQFPESFFMCSLDASLFTNVPLDFTIDTCCDALYRSDVCSPVTTEETYLRCLMMIINNLLLVILDLACDFSYCLILH